MGNVVGSVSSGFVQLLDKILGHPLEFLSGKDCNSKCAPTWDFLCYVENFCISHLLKLIMVAALVYFLLLFLFLVYKLGICQCICGITYGAIYACFATCFRSLDFCCTYICLKLQSVKRKDRRRQRRDIEEFTPPGSPTKEKWYHSQDCLASQQSRRRLHKRRKYSEEHMRRSLRPTSPRTHLKLSSRSIHLHKKAASCDPSTHLLHPRHIHVARRSRFSQKGSRHRTKTHHSRR